MIDYKKTRKHQEAIKVYKDKLIEEKDFKKREILELKIKIEELKIKIERLK